MKRIGLLHRQVGTIEQFPESPLTIDYGTSSELLAKEREKSLRFLQSSLNI